MTPSVFSANVPIHENIFQKGIRLKGKYLYVILGTGTDRYPCPLFCVAKSAFKNKPQRNRLRRLLKEAYRQRDAEPSKSGLIFALVIISDKVSVVTLRQDLNALIQKI